MQSTAGDLKLPIELWRAIFAYLGHADLRQASRICRGLQAEAETVLYRSINAEIHVLRFHHALSAAPRRAHAVRALALQPPYKELRTRTRVWNQVLRMLANLRTLEICNGEVPAHLWGPLVAGCGFRLRAFGSAFGLSPALLGFLERQAAIEDLTLYLHDARLPALAPGVLPALRALETSQSCVSAFAAAPRNITHLHLRCDDPDAIRPALRAFAHQLVSVRVDRQLRPGDVGRQYPTGVVDGIALPALRFLEVRDTSSKRPLTHMDEDTIADALARLDTGLETVIWHPDWFWAHPPRGRKTDNWETCIGDMKRFAAALFQAAPTLRRFAYRPMRTAMLVSCTLERGELHEDEGAVGSSDLWRTISG